MLSILRKLSPLSSHLPPLFSPFSNTTIHISEIPHLCPGCGIHIQNSNPSFPGFFSLPSPKSPIPFTSHPFTSLSLKSGLLQQTSQPNPSIPSPSNPLVCARCHSLKHYGRVNLPSIENLLPVFKFSPVIASPSGPPSVVLLIVDAADFDGSFPRDAARILSASVDRGALAWNENKPSNVPRIVVVVSKFDLLPSCICPEGMGRWVRRRAGELGAGRVDGLHLVSATRDWGVRNLVEEVAKFAGNRGNVWAVGAQNVGKSTLINAMGRCVGKEIRQLTEAVVPGTTLGIVRVDGVLCGKAKLFDTPGMIHSYQITTRLTTEEQKLVHVSKEIKPRTYRIKVGFV